jgi:phospholipase C
MDGFVDNPLCGDARNVAYAEAATVQPYWDLAAGGALADHYFQPILGASAGNNMFLFDAAFVFPDDVAEPDFPGSQCSSTTTKPVTFDGANTIGALLQTAGVSWTFYAEGYAAMLDAPPGQCPTAPDDCAFGLSIYPCVFEPNDVPVTYYPQFSGSPAYLRDYVSFAADLQHGLLSQVAFVKGLGYHTEHPGQRTNISDGIAFVRGVIDAVAHSAYAPDTLILVIDDEGGGYFDHVAPPPSPDEHPYGTRVPAIAVGPFARKGSVSHVQLEHSSIVKFIEWNWIRGDMGPTTGQLGARDAVVANIGSLLDPALGVPEN